jgi:hypothetical protein
MQYTQILQDYAIALMAKQRISRLQFVIIVLLAAKDVKNLVMQQHLTLNVSNAYMDIL